MNEKLSISIVVYKTYKDALKTVESIEKSTSRQLRKIIYIVDNSCLDLNDSEKTAFVAQLSEYSDVVYLDTNDNLGFGKGHNYVMEQLDSEYHAIVNPDIILQEDAFSALISFMEKSNAGMCIPRLIDEHGCLQDAYRRELTVFDLYIRMFTKKAFRTRRDYHSMKDKNYSEPFCVPFGQGSFWVIRTDLWKQLGGFDDRYFMYLEDADLCRRVNEDSRLMYCPHVKVIHKWEKASHRNVKMFVIHVKSIIKYFNKWGWKIY